MLENKLLIEFTVDPKNGHFQGTLPNGAQFQFTLDFVGGKLGANLELFRDAVRALNKNEPFRPTVPVVRPEPLYDESRVRKFTPKGNPELSLADLGLDLGDL